jgi:hypothetical protein
MFQSGVSPKDKDLAKKKSRQTRDTGCPEDDDNSSHRTLDGNVRSISDSYMTMNWGCALKSSDARCLSYMLELTYVHRSQVLESKLPVLSS